MEINIFVFQNLLILVQLIFIVKKTVLYSRLLTNIETNFQLLIPVFVNPQQHQSMCICMVVLLYVWKYI